MCDPTTLDEFRAEDRVVFRYVDNPNGSLDDIAGVCNAGRNVVGLMPHPERASRRDPRLARTASCSCARCSPRAASPTHPPIGGFAVVVEYTFGDSDLARERLALVADTFAAPTRALLADLPSNLGRYVLDLGCGPGHTTALLRDAYPLAQITGFDASESMITEARARVPEAAFAVFDVTQPLLLPADVIYARLLLGHLPDPARGTRDVGDVTRPGARSSYAKNRCATAATTPPSAVTKRSSPQSSPRPARRCGPRRPSTTTHRVASG